MNINSNHSRLEGCFVSGGGRAFQHAPKRCFLGTLEILWASSRWTPHPVIVTIRDHRDYIRVIIFLLYHYYRVGGPPKASSISPWRSPLCLYDQLAGSPTRAIV